MQLKDKLLSHRKLYKRIMISYQKETLLVKVLMVKHMYLQKYKKVESLYLNHSSKWVVNFKVHQVILMTSTQNKFKECKNIWLHKTKHYQEANFKVNQTITTLIQELKLIKPNNLSHSNNGKFRANSKVILVIWMISKNIKMQNDHKWRLYHKINLCLKVIFRQLPVIKTVISLTFLQEKDNSDLLDN